MNVRGGEMVSKNFTIYSGGAFLCTCNGLEDICFSWLAHGLLYQDEESGWAVPKVVTRMPLPELHVV